MRPGGILNRRGFVTGLTSLGSLMMVRGAFGSIEHESALEQRVRAQLDLGVSDGLTMGAVMMVVQREKVLAFEAAGYSNADEKTPMRTDAIFDIRSISKAVTVFGALLLIDEGKFALDDPLARFLPEFSRVKVKGQTQPTNVAITIRQMMLHSSGIAEDRPPELENITRSFDHTLTEAVALVAQQPLDFTPGTQWAYSSSGIAVLGRVIEVVSGQSYESFMQQRVFQPLEMEDSSFFTNRAKIARIPTMYNLEKGHLIKDVMDVTRPGQRYSAPEFGMFSTAEDLRHYCQMILDRGSWKGRKILSSKLVDEMTRPEMQTAVPKYQAGLGFAIHTGREAEMSYAVKDGSFGANGASGCIIWMDPSLQLMRIYLTHYFLGDFRDGNPVMNAAFPG
jgi:CubicO group peptidase (beta-lactamase class C family)